MYRKILKGIMVICILFSIIMIWSTWIMIMTDVLKSVSDIEGALLIEKWGAIYWLERFLN